MTKQTPGDRLPRTVLVTGAGRRIGRAIARDLGRHGWAVALHYHRSIAAAEDVAQEIRAAGGTACTLAADLSRETEVVDLVERAVEALGPVGCLVNNASLFEDDTVHTATRESWDAHMEINLRAPFVLTQHFARQGPALCSGVVINIIDQRVWNVTPYFASYTLSKAGLWSLTRMLALALAPRIRVNAIGPGPTLPSARQTPEQFRRQCGSMPLRRGTTPEEITAAVRFIIGAPAMTGQMIALDGGQHLAWAHSGEDDVPAE
ncbi:MAG: 3-oxoacyl-ACP reductase [Rhodospirillaceae bacterium]|nr:MAG: 3-oxoacyl-ACP reductase [Rhodospirillaceae bacterium]